MTEITSDRHPSLRAAPSDTVYDAGAGTGEHHGRDPLVPAELRGCPFAAPGVMVTRAQVAEGRLKVPCANGYDHFEFDSYVTRSGQLIPVFAWTDRTRVAE